jgi:hypothetical protein
MLEELRLSPCAAAARSRGRCAGQDATAGGGDFDPNLSTAFAERGRLPSTGSLTPIHRTWVGTNKEEVG